jgi:valyl-tRNA synthetase
MDPTAVTSTSNQMDDPNAPKSKNADKNEAKKKAKMDKLAAKKAKQQDDTSIAVKPAKKEKPKKEAVVEAEVAVPVTPEGEKKDMSGPMAAAYSPKVVESAWYAWWQKQGYFKPQLIEENGKARATDKGTFVIPIPPPNVTGMLHIGHALTEAIQDTLVRWHRMRGFSTLFIPGCDHAGISTQVVVEKMLWKNGRQTRHDLGREVFVDKVWQWKEDYGDRIYDQLKRLGGSYEWDRVRFTLDPQLVKAVTETFVRLHDDGVVYRSSRLVNWCTQLNTTLSNLEVDNRELPGRTLLNVPGYDKPVECGVLVSFAYQVENSDERIVVATTRVETMLGDTAIAVHPDDERYKHLHGKFVVHPFLDRRIPIVTDEIAVDMAFGTGAVKITPAHDFNDYEVGKRNNLAFINILNEDGTFNDTAGPYAACFPCGVSWLCRA